MDTVFLELLNRSIAAGWLILAVFLLRLLLNKAPKNLHCLLWGLVAFRMVLPARIKSPFSLVPSAQIIRPEALLTETPSIHSGLAVVDRSVNASVAQALTPVVEASVNPLQLWMHVGALIWLAGLCAMLLYVLLSYLRLLKLVADSFPLRDNIRLSERLDSPFVLGMISPRIYIPHGLNEETMALVLAHEQGHILRHDHWFKPLGFLLLSLCWFHPLFWLAYVFFSRDIELACDELVIRQLGADVKKAYSRALLNCSVVHKGVTPCPLAFGESDVKTRIKNILHYRKPTLWILLASALAVVVLAVCFLTDPLEETNESAIPGYIENTNQESPNDLADWTAFEAELFRKESEPAYGEYTLYGYGISNRAPLLFLPEAETKLTNSQIYFTWDNNMGLLRHKELWYNEAEKEVLVAHWITGLDTPDPEYEKGSFEYPNYDWARKVQEYSFTLDDTMVYLRYYSADKTSLDLRLLSNGASFISPLDLAYEQLGISYDTMLSGLMKYEINGTYTAFSREEFTARWGSTPLIALPEGYSPFAHVPDELYVLDFESEQPRVAQLWVNPYSGIALYASQRLNPGSSERTMSMTYNRSTAGRFLDWAHYMAESRGNIDGYDIVLRFYALDRDYDPEYCRLFMENITLSAWS